MRTLTVWCADWPVASAGVAPDDPAAVVRANRVVACTPAARVHDVQPGQRRREAQARCPDLAVIERDESREVRAYEVVVRAVEAFTPRVELTVPGRCAFPTRGPARYFGGEPALASRLLAGVDEALAGLGWAGHARIGVADGSFAADRAALLAETSGDRHQRVRIVAVGESPSFLAGQPVEVLARPELAGVLARLGVRTLGEFAALHAADVVARFGADGQLAHRLAGGRDGTPPAVADPPPDLVVATDLDPPAERVDLAAFAAKTLADELFARLAERALSCARVAIAAETDHGESIERLWRHEGALTAAAVADRARWQLDGWLNGPAAVRPTAGIVRLRLTPDELGPARGRQLGFWGGETAAAERAARALARVQGLLGPDAVRVPEWHGGRSPAEQLALVPAQAVDLTARRPAAAPDWVRAPWPGRLPAPSPAEVHPSPLPVVVLDAADRPVGVTGRGLLTDAPVRLLPDHGDGETVTSWAGPWPVEERWWDPASSRRRARFQVVLDSGRAHLLAVEGGRWWIEATYD